MLSSIGVNVELCMTFESAMKRLQTGGFDLLLSDFNLGGGHTAFELIALLRALPEGRDIPAVLLSAYGSVDDLKRSRHAGFFAHLVKPAEDTDVARCLYAAIARPTAETGGPRRR